MRGSSIGGGELNFEILGLEKKPILRLSLVVTRGRELMPSDGPTFGLALQCIELPLHGSQLCPLRGSALGPSGSVSTARSCSPMESQTALHDDHM